MLISELKEQIIDVYELRTADWYINSIKAYKDYKSYLIGVLIHWVLKSVACLTFICVCHGGYIDSGILLKPIHLLAVIIWSVSFVISFIRVMFCFSGLIFHLSCPICIFEDKSGRDILIYIWLRNIISGVEKIK